MPEISIHAPSRGRHPSQHNIWLLQEFQSTPPRGGDGRNLPGPQYLPISIHAPSRGRPGGSRNLRQGGHFNPRPLAGATPDVWQDGNGGLISIHAPSRGRLDASLLRIPFLSISIHAPSRGRLSAITATIGTLNFNPRPLAGATRPFRMQSGRLKISIHAPSRGRLGRAHPVWYGFRFQSTPPRGGDYFDHHESRTCKISIHAPSRGRLRIWPYAPRAWKISIHAPSRGRLSDEAVRFHLTSPSFFREGQFSDFLSPVIRCFFFLFASPSRLQHHGGLRVVSPFGSQVLDFVLIRIAQVVEPQAVVVFVDEGFQFSFQ